MSGGFLCSNDSYYSIITNVVSRLQCSASCLNNNYRHSDGGASQTVCVGFNVKTVNDGLVVCELFDVIPISFQQVEGCKYYQVRV